MVLGQMRSDDSRHNVLHTLRTRVMMQCATSAGVICVGWRGDRVASAVATIRRRHITVPVRAKPNDGHGTPENDNKDNVGDQHLRRRRRQHGAGTTGTWETSSRREACARLSVATVGVLAAPLLGAPSPAFGKPEDIAEAYDRYAATYDDLDGGVLATDTLGLDAMRKTMLARASGEVLELGVGTGLNLPGYDMSDKVTSLTAVDISNGMLALARDRAGELGMRVTTEEEWESLRRAKEAAAAAAAATPEESTTSEGSPAPSPPNPPPPPAPTSAAGKDDTPPVRFIVADAEALPFPDASFDCVVDTFSLCVIENPLAALQEVRRVLRPGGRALLIEHSKSTVVPLLGAYQDVTGPAVTKLAKGCAWNQDVLGLVKTAGLTVVKAEPSLLGILTTLELKP